MTRGIIHASKYIEPMRQNHPSRYGTADSLTMNNRVGPGMWYEPTTLRKKQPANTSDCTRKNQNSVCGSCIFIGRNGNTPPHAPAAFTARNDA